MKFYLESNLEAYVLSKLSDIYIYIYIYIHIFCNPTELACFIPSVVQNNMLSTKIRIKLKRIKLN